MSEPGYEDYGYDTVGDYDAGEYTDTETLAAAAQQAAAAAAQQVSDAYAPIIAQQQSQLNAMSAVAMHEAMRRQQEDQDTSNARLQEAVSRAGQRFGGEWNTISKGIADRVQQDPTFLPDSSWRDVDSATNALVDAGRLVREDLARQVKQANDERADDLLNEMKQAWPTDFPRTRSSIATALSADGFSL
jgi:hypothetical protein